MMRRRQETPAPKDVAEQLDELTADVYEGDLGALRDHRQRSIESKPQANPEAGPADAKARPDESRDALWPLIR